MKCTTRCFRSGKSDSGDRSFVRIQGPHFREERMTRSVQWAERMEPTFQVTRARNKAEHNATYQNEELGFSWLGER